jgi:hypothetical protein
MRIDQSVNLDLLSKLGDATGDVQQQVSIGILKETMDSAEANTMQLLQSLQPHLGQNIDVRL